MRNLLLVLIPILLAVVSCNSRKGSQPGSKDMVKEYAVMAVSPQATTMYKEYPTVLTGQQTVGYSVYMVVVLGDTVMTVYSFTMPLASDCGPFFEPQERTASRTGMRTSKGFSAFFLMFSSFQVRM